jgi:RNA polymerase sigma-70 factor (ECF subfamily)
LDQWTDLDLAERARTSRAANEAGLAFSELYRRHFKRVYGYHLLRTGNIDDAQDLTSQTFMAALEGIHRYSGRGSFAAWLMSIAHNKMALHYRGMRPAASLEDWEQLPQSNGNPEDIANRRGIVHQVRAALTRLPSERAEAFVLRTFGGLTAAETAQVLGKSEAAIKMHVHRALKDLRQILEVVPGIAAQLEEG